MKTFYKQTRGEPVTDPTDLPHYDLDVCSEADAQWFQHDAFLSGDYCGCGTVVISNRNVLAAEFPELAGVAYWPGYGSHGSEWVWFKADLSAWPELVERLAKLEYSSYLDEDDLSNVEAEEQHKAWEDYGADDFRRELHTLAPHHDELFGRIPNGTLGIAWSLYCDKHCGGEECIHEQCGAYFPFPSADRNRMWTWNIVRSFLREALDQR